MVPQELRNRATYILVKLSPGVDLERVRAEICRRLPHNDVWTRDEWAARSRGYWTETTGLGLNMVMTVFLGCIVGVSVVAQTLYTSTIEHLKEFAMVKAIGGGNAEIYAIIGEQAAIAAVCGYGLGAAMAYGLCPVMASLELKLSLTSALAISVFVGTLALCLGSAAISCRKVATLDPALVFRA
jgi:putative ABC transport system permease protein